MWWEVTAVGGWTECGHGRCWVSISECVNLDCVLNVCSIFKFFMVGCLAVHNNAHITLPL